MGGRYYNPRNAVNSFFLLLITRWTKFTPLFVLLMCSYQTIFSLVSLNSRNTYLHALYTKKSLFFENSSRREGKEKLFGKLHYSTLQRIVIKNYDLQRLIKRRENTRRNNTRDSLEKKKIKLEISKPWKYLAEIIPCQSMDPSLPPSPSVPCLHRNVETQMVQGTDLFEAQSTKQGRENRVASHGCPVAFSRRILKALRLPWQPTTAAARCNYLKNARRSPIPLAPPLYHPPPLRGLLGTGRCKSSRSLLHHHGQSKILYIFVHFITCSSGVIHGMIHSIAWIISRESYIF